MQGKLTHSDWKLIEEALKVVVEDASYPKSEIFGATLDRIQFHNKTGPYDLKLVH